MVLIRTKLSPLVLKQTNVKCVQLKEHLFWRQISCKKWIGFAFQILLRVPRILGVVCSYAVLFLSMFSSLLYWQKKSHLHQEKQEFICFMWAKSKGEYMQVWLFYRYIHLCHRIKRGFVNSLVFLCWHFLCRQRSSFVREPGTCTQLCSVMESQACVSWSLETSKEKGDLSKDESVGDREHCIFCGAVLRGRGRWERCLHSIPKPPPPTLPKPVLEKGRKRQTCWSTTKPCSRKMKALGGNITPMHLWNTSPGEEEWGKSRCCCYGNQILPITGRRCAKVLGSLAAAHIMSQTPPPISFLPLCSLLRP